MLPCNMNGGSGYAGQHASFRTGPGLRPANHSACSGKMMISITFPVVLGVTVIPVLGNCRPKVLHRSSDHH